MRKLTSEAKITIFKSLVISKIVYLALLTKIPNSVIEELKQFQKMFLWGNKIKHDTLCNKYKDSHGSSPPILGGDLKIPDQNNCGTPEQKNKFGGELNLRGDLKL